LQCVCGKGHENNQAAQGQTWWNVFCKTVSNIGQVGLAAKVTEVTEVTEVG
jgi:hypothetical protein